MPNWENGCIYMLRHKDDVELQNIYIGSTTNFRGRKYEHKECCNNQNYKNYNGKKYQYIRANGGWDNWKMIWLEDYPCKSKKELALREDVVMLQYQNKLNQLRAHTTDEEKKQQNKERNKKYYENNKEELNEKTKMDKAKKTCDNCGSEVRKNGLKRHQRSAKCQSHKKST